MAQKHRSPNCPDLTFADAIERGRKVYVEERQHPATREVIAKDLGYSGMNGASLSTLGALRQYGILEGNGDSLRVSEDAVAYFVRDDDAIRKEAMMRMLFKPALFEEMRNTYKDGLPSDGNLR